MIEKKEINVSKDLSEVMKLIKDIVVCIVTKGDYMSLIPSLVAAVEGVTDIDDDVKADWIAGLNSVSMGVTEIVDVFVKNPFADKEEATE